MVVRYVTEMSIMLTKQYSLCNSWWNLPKKYIFSPSSFTQSCMYWCYFALNCYKPKAAEFLSKCISLCLKLIKSKCIIYVMARFNNDFLLTREFRAFMSVGVIIMPAVCPLLRPPWEFWGDGIGQTFVNQLVFLCVRIQERLFVCHTLHYGMWQAVHSSNARQDLIK